MAVVCDARGRRVTLAARSLVGRSADCLVSIDDRRVSAEHAVISWTGKKWTVRDLGSRNGTQVSGARLAPGARVAVRSGARLAFADVEWTLANDAPPVVRAVCRETGQELFDDGEGVLLLAESPLLAVASSGRGWVLEAAGEATRPVWDHEEISVASRTWVLELPPATHGQTESTDHVEVLSLADSKMRFFVSRDGEHVSLELESPGLGVVRLPSRAHQQVLLLLARARLADIERGAPEGEAGWVYSDDLPRQLAMNRTRVNLELYRARKLLEQHGLVHPDRIVERRADTQQLRIGTARVEVVKS